MQTLISNAVVSSKVTCAKAANELLELLHHLGLNPHLSTETLPDAAITLLEHDHIRLGEEVLIIHRAVAGRCATVVSHDTTSTGGRIGNMNKWHEI